LYLPKRDIEQLRKIVDVPALSPGWQQSFRDMLRAHETPAPPPVGIEPGWNGFRRLRVSAVRRESPQVLSIRLEADDRSPLPPPLPGQYLTVRIPGAGEPAPLRSYSLSGDPSAGDYRISVKREDHGLVSQWMHDHIAPGSVVESAAPRGDFCLTDGSDPVVLISAGIGITPVLAMLHSLATVRSDRHIWWLHTIRDRETQAFAAEVATLIESLPHVRQLVCYTRTQGRLNRSAIAALNLPPYAAAYLCGPTQFMTDMRDALTGAGVDARADPQRIVRRPPADQPGHRRRRRAQAATPAGGNARNRAVDHVRPQRTHGQLVLRLRHYPRPGRGLRCPNPLLVPKRGMSYV
jgi:ferredoxin-NADP reductase